MRAQLMTGQYGVRLGFLDVLTPITSPGHLPLDVPSLAEGMRAAGCAWAPPPLPRAWGLGRTARRQPAAGSRLAHTPQLYQWVVLALLLMCWCWC